MNHFIYISIKNSGWKKNSHKEVIKTTTKACQFPLKKGRKQEIQNKKNNNGKIYIKLD